MQENSVRMWYNVQKGGETARLELMGDLLALGAAAEWAAALCFVTWNLAVRALGSLRTSAYIYLVSVITAAASALFLGERLTPAALLGIGLTLVGLLLSEDGGNKRRRVLDESVQ